MPFAPRGKAVCRGICCDESAEDCPPLGRRRPLSEQIPLFPPGSCTRVRALYMRLAFLLATLGLLIAPLRPAAAQRGGGAPPPKRPPPPATPAGAPPAPAQGPRPGGARPTTPPGGRAASPPARPRGAGGSSKTTCGATGGGGPAPPGGALPIRGGPGFKRPNWGRR